ncbi:hypothetical protein BTVI_26549 [Pitangus sulphuratus]|nr:hypothetical protein BTVI_26549 [Pitangus sulphuratus]
MSKVLVWGGAGAELPPALDAPRVSNTGMVLLSSPVVIIPELGVLVRGRCPPVAEVPSAEKGQSKMDLCTLSYEQRSDVYRQKPPRGGQSSPGEVLSEADGEPGSNGFVDVTVASLSPSPCVPKEDWKWPEELMFSVPAVNISVVWASLMLAGRDLNVLPPLLVPVMDMKVPVVSLTGDMDKDRIVPEVLYVPLLDVETSAAHGLLVVADLGVLPPLLLPVAEMESLNSLVEVLCEAGGKPVSNGSVTPLPPPSRAPVDIPGVWAEELMISVPEVEISATLTSLVLAGRDLNVLPPPLVAAVEMEALVAGKSETFLFVAELLDG